MKKNYFLSLVVSLLVAVTASAADNLVGIYKLSNLTEDQKEALGTIDAEAAIRILPGDADADYYISGIADFGCKLYATYDEAAGTLTAVEPSGFDEQNMMLLYYGDAAAYVIDGTTSITFIINNDGTLKIDTEMIVADGYTDEVLGIYAPGITLAKDETPAISIADIVGKYTFTGTGVNPFAETLEDYITELEYTMSIEQGEGNSLTINGFMGVDGIQATYIPEVGMIQIVNQEVGEIFVSLTIGDIYFTVSESELKLITPARVLDMVYFFPLASVIDGKAVKESADGIENTIASSAATISVSNGAIYVNSAEPVAVQVFNAAGVQVYADTVANSAITLPHGVYFVKVAGNAKAVSVAL